MDISRRDFLKVVGASATALFFLEEGLKNFTLTATVQEAETATEVAQTVCGICDSECALRYILRNGKVVEVEGVPGDPASDGKPCIKGLSSYRFLYDPDRLKGPLMRTNPERGKDIDPKWKKISYEEAYKIVGEKLKEISDKYGPESIICLMRPKDEQKHFAKSIGTPNHVCHVDTCYLAHEVAWHVTAGGYKKYPEKPDGKPEGPIGKPWVWDYANAKYIVGFGYDMLGKSKRVYAKGIQAALDNGAKVVIFDPRLSITASKATEWIPIKPGTDLAVALAMINVIVNENLYDSEFVSKYTHGSDQLKAHVQQYTPEWASKISEVPADTIRRIARKFATTRPAVIAEHKRDAGGPLYVNSFHLARAMIILNALVGSIDRPGGPIYSRKPKMPEFGDVFPFAYPKPKVKERIDGMDKWPLSVYFNKGSFANLAEGILSEKPYPAKAMVVHKYNLTSFPNPQKMIEAMKKLDFVATFDVVLSEMAQMSDIVIPGFYFPEKGGFAVRGYSAWYPQIAIKEEVKVYDLKSLGESFNGILKAMALSQFVVDWKAFGAAKLNALGITKDDIKKAPNGIWGEPTPHKPKTEFGMPTKKVELYSTLCEKNGYDPLPKWEEKKAHPQAENEFYFLTNHHAWYRMANPAQINDPLLAGLQSENYCWINPKPAQKLGIKDEDEVMLTSVTGSKIKLKAKLTETIRPDCVMTEHGYGHWSKGYTVARNKGADDGEVLPNWKAEDKLKIKDPACGSAILDVAVKVEKA